jgi:hypothetical protein
VVSSLETLLRALLTAKLLGLGVGVRSATNSEFSTVSTLNPGLYLWIEGLPRRGYRTQPRVSTLGTLKMGFALKGREMRVPDETRTYCRTKESAHWACYHWTIGLRLHLVRTFDLAPPSGRVARGGRLPGLKPWTEPCSPIGAQNNVLSPRIVP